VVAVIVVGEGSVGAQGSDAALVRAAQCGSAAAFDLLLLRYHDPVRRYLLRQSGDPEVAADLLQETFLDAYRSLGRLADDRPFAAWLYRIARNNLRREWRARRLRRLVSLDWLRERAADTLPALRQPDASAATEARDLVQRALDGLSPKLREVLLLHHLWGFTAPEIAQILNLSPEAAARRLSRASEQFRQRRAALWGD
jgi:RNA polymerase sigma-70 factor (ECF subfamily)